MKSRYYNIVIILKNATLLRKLSYIFPVSFESFLKFANLLVYLLLSGKISGFDPFHSITSSKAERSREPRSWDFLTSVFFLSFSFNFSRKFAERTSFFRFLNFSVYPLAFSRKILIFFVHLVKSRSFPVLFRWAPRFGGKLLLFLSVSSQH